MKSTFIILFIMLYFCSSETQFSSPARRQTSVPEVDPNNADLNTEGISDQEQDYREPEDTREVDRVKPDPEKCEEGTEGRIVLTWDEWLFSNVGFSKGSNTAAFVGNVTRWLKRCYRKSGHKFHALSNAFSLNGDQLSRVLSSAGYTYTTGLELELSLENLRRCDWIFFSGWTPISDQNKFADLFESYVKDGGNILIAGGTRSHGGQKGEAIYYNYLIQRFGLHYSGGKDGGQGLKNVNMDHEIFDGFQSFIINTALP